MKKYLFLIPLFFIMLIPNINVNALTYLKDNETIEVTGDNFLYYVYQNYAEDFENYKYIIATTDKTYSYKVVLSNVEPILQSNNILLYNIPENDTAISFNYYVSSDTFKRQESTNTSFASNNVSYLRFHNFTFNNQEANISLNELKAYFGQTVLKYTITYYLNNEVYQTFEVETGTSHTLINYDYNTSLYNFSGWIIETENVDLTNVTQNIVIRGTLEQKIVNPVYINNFPITKEEYYVLLVLLSTLIIMQFLKWCFPFKGGSDLR